MRVGHDDQVDVENVAEEIESMGRPQASPLQTCGRLMGDRIREVLLQRERFTRSRQGTMMRERFDAAAPLKEGPRLPPSRAEIFAEARVRALGLASADTGLPVRVFPVEAPSTLEQASGEDGRTWRSPVGPSAT